MAHLFPISEMALSLAKNLTPVEYAMSFCTTCHPSKAGKSQVPSLQESHPQKNEPRPLPPILSPAIGPRGPNPDSLVAEERRRH